MLQTISYCKKYEVFLIILSNTVVDPKRERGSERE